MNMNNERFHAHQYVKTNLNVNGFLSPRSLALSLELIDSTGDITKKSVDFLRRNQYSGSMTKEKALVEAKKAALQSGMIMAVVNDVISNAEDETGSWGYCPNIARGPNGKLILFPWATETILVHPA